MAQVKKNKKLTASRFSLLKKEVSNFFYVLLTLLYLLSIYSHDPSDPSFLNSGLASSVNNYIGVFGAYVSYTSFMLFGNISFALPFLAIFIIIKNSRANSEYRPSDRFMNSGLLVIIILSSCIIMAFLGIDKNNINHFLLGGEIGNLLFNKFSAYIGISGTVVVSILLLFYSSLTYLHISIKLLVSKTLLISKYVYLKSKFIINSNYEKIKLYNEKRKDSVQAAKLSQEIKESKASIEIPKTPKHSSKRAFKEKQTELFSTPSKAELPLLELLVQHESEAASYDDESLQLMSRLLETNLNDFGIAVDVISVKPGPVVTLFEINPAKGVKVNQITNLSKDLARTMSVTSLRVVDNIPGTSSIGIEVPNENREIVSLREIIISKKYEDAKSPLTMALGKDIQGKPICADLQKLPHLLVAGTTGSGKSVTLHTMLVSLLYKSDPTDLQLLLVDPKMLELSVYDGIPHLLNPVITDMNDATNGLRWCVQQMEKRYRVMNELKVRDIKAYNKLVGENEQSGDKLEINSHQGADVIYHEKLPYIVVVIDEFADMMLQVGKKVEDLIIRLAAKARASGIHLILATQRPSVNVITGLIKANIPARIALQVTTNIDSRTIIDSMGAENLLGNGDMLFMSPGSRVPKRIHGAYVSDDEVKQIVQFLKKNSESTYIESLLTSVDEDSSSDVIDNESSDDPLYKDAVQIVMETKKTSISFIQRKLRIGYNRAANIIEAMETNGILSEQQSNGNREILNHDG
ncbi:MAG: cell division protein FtsK [Gammaproteobacteria bacterium]|nr:cell division protein FtsK [Gammaproteobacteria bacterium]MBT4462794.1 cell division protein FtsK [Gammaproteobacteria bacterium]MBT4654330.1 cell division protein FtsK [Gammaproteobacteria bacterium]MBT5117350.1 cell division protein FtsK [Gammaproteobacteria bacterium]MBT5761921.1 cell division protein FtsK [Gammaproteobacteria bacterium]